VGFLKSLTPILKSKIIFVAYGKGAEEKKRDQTETIA